MPIARDMSTIKKKFIYIHTHRIGSKFSISPSQSLERPCRAQLTFSRSALNRTPSSLKGFVVPFPFTFFVYIEVTKTKQNIKLSHILFLKLVFCIVIYFIQYLMSLFLSMMKPQFSHVCFYHPKSTCIMQP